jgi:tRNA(adenine34) deaminase
MQALIDDWMQLALVDAERAMALGEIPVAAILIAEDQEIGRETTAVARFGTLAAHAELLCLLNAKNKLWTPARPLRIITTLEPCLMCFGAAIQVGVDEIYYGMRATPDGVESNFPNLLTYPGAPKVHGGLAEEREVTLMRRLLKDNPAHPSAEYVRDMLKAY